MELVKVILLAVVLVSLAFLGLAVRLLLHRGGSFPNMHISRNKPLKRKGIYCAQTQDRQEQKKARGKVNYQKARMIPPEKTKNGEGRFPA
jgi:hypothetical protein